MVLTEAAMNILYFECDLLLAVLYSIIRGMCDKFCQIIYVNGFEGNRPLYRVCLKCFDKLS